MLDTETIFRLRALLLQHGIDPDCEPRRCVVCNNYLLPALSGPRLSRNRTLCSPVCRQAKWRADHPEDALAQATDRARKRAKNGQS